MGDGLAAVAELAETGKPDLDVLIVDAGSGDPTLPMSCPPPAFLERPFLESARASLRRDGLLMVNCVSRSGAAFAAAVAALKVGKRRMRLPPCSSILPGVLLGPSQGCMQACIPKYDVIMLRAQRSDMRNTTLVTREDSYSSSEAEERCKQPGSAEGC
jgi:hypothetical protein